MFNILKKVNYSKLVKEKNRADTFGFHEEKYFNDIVETKYGESVLLSYPEDLNDELATIFLTSIINQKYHRALMYLIFKNNTMQIQDIKVLNDAKSKGYGDLLMEKAIEIAKQKNMKIITGRMVSESIEHRNRQVKYYTKHGFEIDEKNILMKYL
ncbi:GNAT family N-acetyltransferase [Lysinibacillus sp. NPDC093712]|uniref:GNAT family N-acetyltransferase n=1 Tax=Lysinibacillus sp. NPDC093712 TaxID=3390579 RepID=UPI003CFE8CBD